MNEVLKVDFDQMMGEKYSLGEARQLRRNLEETHMKMRENLKRKLANYLDPFLEMPSSEKYH